MDSVTLEQIEELARGESDRLSHFYLGVEHLFIALTRLRGGVVAYILDELGQSAHYLRYTVRDLVGRGDEQRLWTGHPVTPRARRVLDDARAWLQRGLGPADRAVLLAILEEGESAPMRALRSSNIDLDEMHRLVVAWSGEVQIWLPTPKIEGEHPLDADQQAVIEQMFRKYTRVRIEQRFDARFSSEQADTILLIRPILSDGRTEALVVVKLADRQAILWEKKRYDIFVRDRLPPHSSRIDADPTLPDESSLGGLKYTFIRSTDEDVPMNLADLALSVAPRSLARFIRDGLYRGFQETWWGQAQPYNFVLWREYDLLLPPILTVEPIDPPELGATGYVLHPPLAERIGQNVRAGDHVALEDFTVFSVQPDEQRLHLITGEGPEAVNLACRIVVENAPASRHLYTRGEVLPRLVGRVVKTRDDLLLEQLLALEPDFPGFEPTDNHLPIRPELGRALPNPIRAYKELLDRRVVGTFSTLHGDLHCGNVLFSVGGDAWLIDFQWARDGHTLFDWAVLETSLLADHTTRLLLETWDTLWAVIVRLDSLPPSLSGGISATAPEDILTTDELFPIVELRGIVGSLLARREGWSEYFPALALSALRVIGWPNRPLGARRLAFLLAAWATEMAGRARQMPPSEGQTPTDHAFDQTMDG